jgi:hypothetical protein
MRILLVEAVLKGFKRNDDLSVTYNFKTMQEVSQDDFSLTDQYFKQPGFLAFKLDEIDIDEIPEDNTKVKGQKSRSQMQRLKIFALHMKKGGNKHDFQPFYERYMDRIDRAIQDELDALED